MKTGINRIFAAVLALLTAVAMLPLAAFATGADISISTADEFRKFAENVNAGDSYEGKTVRLDVNIELGGESNPWSAIGTSSSPFKGTFDGNYHVISGLYIASGSAVGLFGNVNGGEIKNTVVRGSVTGASDVAGVVGKLTSGKVTNCGNEATVSGGSNVGGVVGSVNNTCTVSSCYNKGSVTGSIGYIGGVTGQHWREGTLENCYNSGTVTGPATVGGVTGGHKAASPVLNNCYNSGNVVDSKGNNNNIGAIIGAGRGTNTNCYYIKGTGTNIKGGVTEVESITAEMLSDAFTDGESTLVLSWESKVSTDAPIRPAFTESTERSASLAEYIKAAVKSTKTQSGIDGSLLGNEGYMAGASSTATDWMALAMGRFGYFASGEYTYLIDDGTGYEDYLAAMEAYIEKTYAENGGKLHSVKATEWHRAVVTIAALGGDPTAFGTYNGQPIDLIADGSYNCSLRQGPGTQGINGWIWGLLALDTGMYSVPADARYTRDAFITEILKLQLTDGVGGAKYGGWVLGGYGSSSDVDITAMAIQALAPYYNDDTVYTYTNLNSGETVSKTVHQCVNEALDRLSSMMNSNAGFSSWNTDNVESISQVVVALCSLGINPAEDSRFITSDGKTLLDGMLRFKADNGGFCHILGGGWNSMANDQATYALVSWWRLENGMRALYDMRDDFAKEDLEKISAAEEAVSKLGIPTDSDYKTQLKNALGVFNKVPDGEKRYVKNYGDLAFGIELVGGTFALDTDDKYVAAVALTSLPHKLVYFEGEYFDPTGMTVSITYSDGETVETDDYVLSVIGALKTGVLDVYVICGRLKAKLTVTVNEKMPWEGEGSEDSPYLINDAQGLCNLATKVNGGKNFVGEFFVLTDNIDLSDISSWTPVGRTSACQFEGTFDGQGYFIDNLYSVSGGLFGYVGNNAVIKNTGVASGEIRVSNSSFVGGIAKWSNGADFINCMNGADIYCGGYSGGIVGTVRNGGESNILGCYNVGNIVSQSSAVGGIVGHLDTTRTGYSSVKVTIENCYNTGSITASDNAGGIVGRAQDGHKIINCYNAGAVILTDETPIDGAGGIASLLTNGNEVINCYYDTAYTQYSVFEKENIGVGKNAEEMTAEGFAQMLGAGFKDDRYALENGGYPLLSYQNTDRADDIDTVVEKISAVGEITLEKEDLLKEAREAFDALDESLREYVTNTDILLSGETELLARKEAASFDSMIAELGDITLEKEQLIKQLLNVYGELSSEAKSFVENYFVLCEAKNTLDELKNSREESNGQTGGGEAEENGKTDTSNKTEQTTSPETGDSLMTELYIFGALLSLCALILLLKEKKKING